MATFKVTDPNSGKMLSLTSEDDTPPTEQELEEVFSSVGSNESQVSNTPFTQPQVAMPNESTDKELPFVDLAQLAFKSDSGKVSYLKEKFKFVEQNPETGEILAGNNPMEMTPYDPNGMDNGYAGFVASAVSMIPEIAGQIGGSLVGTALAGGNPLGAIPGGGIGSTTGTTFKQTIGNMLPGSDYTPEEAATDKVLSGLFGAGGETLGIALKGAGKYLIKPQLTKMFDSAIKANPESSKMLKTIAKTFKFAASVDEKDTIDAGLYGFNKTLTPEYSDPKYVTTITKEIVEGVVEHDKIVGEMVGQGDKWAVGKFGQESVNLQDIGNQFITRLSENDIAFIDPLRRSINKKAFANISDLSAFRNIMGEFFGMNPKTGELIPKNKKFGELLLTRKRMDQFLKNYSKSENGNVYASNAIEDFVSSVRKKLAETTLPKGLTTSNAELMEKVVQNNPYLQANKVFSAWKKDLDLLAQNGLDVSDMSKLRSSITESGVANSRVEKFVGNLQNKTFSSSGTLERIVKQLPKKYAGGGIGGVEGTIFDEIRKFNAAQGFRSANVNLLRFSSIAAYAGIFGFGFADTKVQKTASLAGGLLLGTPAGASIVLRKGEKLAMTLNKKSFSKLASQGIKIASDRKALALLSSLLRQNAKNDERIPRQ